RRRRDRRRPPAGGVGCADHRAPALRAEAPRRKARHRLGLHRRRPGHRPAPPGLMPELLHDWDAARSVRKPFAAVRPHPAPQRPPATGPPIEAKIEILHLLDELGVYQLDVGLPGAGAHQKAAVKRLAEEKRDAKLAIRLNVACRTVVSDLAPAADLQQETGVP